MEDITTYQINIPTNTGQTISTQFHFKQVVEDKLSAISKQYDEPMLNLVELQSIQLVTNLHKAILDYHRIVSTIFANQRTQYSKQSILSIQLYSYQQWKRSIMSELEIFLLSCMSIPFFFYREHSLNILDSYMSTLSIRPLSGIDPSTNRKITVLGQSDINSMIQLHISNITHDIRSDKCMKQWYQPVFDRINDIHILTETLSHLLHTNNHPNELNNWRSEVLEVSQSLANCLSDKNGETYDLLSQFKHTMARSLEYISSINDDDILYTDIAMTLRIEQSIYADLANSMELEDSENKAFMTASLSALCLMVYELENKDENMICPYDCNVTVGILKDIVKETIDLLKHGGLAMYSTIRLQLDDHHDSFASITYLLNRAVSAIYCRLANSAIHLGQYAILPMLEQSLLGDSYDKHDYEILKIRKDVYYDYYNSAKLALFEYKQNVKDLLQIQINDNDNNLNNNMTIFILSIYDQPYTIYYRYKIQLYSHTTKDYRDRAKRYLLLQCNDGYATMLAKFVQLQVAFPLPNIDHNHIDHMALIDIHVYDICKLRDTYCQLGSEYMKKCLYLLGSFTGIELTDSEQEILLVHQIIASLIQTITIRLHEYLLNPSYLMFSESQESRELERHSPLLTLFDIDTILPPIQALIVDVVCHSDEENRLYLQVTKVLLLLTLEKHTELHHTWKPWLTTTGMIRTYGSSMINVESIELIKSVCQNLRKHVINIPDSNGLQIELLQMCLYWIEQALIVAKIQFDRIEGKNHRLVGKECYPMKSDMMKDFEQLINFINKRIIDVMSLSTQLLDSIAKDDCCVHDIEVLLSKELDVDQLKFMEGFKEDAKCVEELMHELVIKCRMDYKYAIETYMKDGELLKRQRHLDQGLFGIMTR